MAGRQRAEQPGHALQPPADERGAADHEPRPPHQPPAPLQHGHQALHGVHGVTDHHTSIYHCIYVLRESIKYSFSLIKFLSIINKMSINE